MKKMVRKRLVPPKFRVSSTATMNAITLMAMVDSIAKSAVNQKELATIPTSFSSPVNICTKLSNPTHSILSMVLNLKNDI